MMQPTVATLRVKGEHMASCFGTCEFWYDCQLPGIRKTETDFFLRK